MSKICNQNKDIASMKCEVNDNQYDKCEANEINDDKFEVVEQQYDKIEVVDNAGEKCEVDDSLDNSGNKIVNRHKKRKASTNKQFVEEPEQQNKRYLKQKQSTTHNIDTVKEIQEKIDNAASTTSQNCFAHKKDHNSQQKTSKFWILTMLIGLILFFSPLVVTDETITLILMLISLFFLILSIILLYIRRGKKRNIW